MTILFRKTTMLAVIALALAACNNKNTTNQASTTKAEHNHTSCSCCSHATKTYTPAQAKTKASELVGHTVSVRGEVTHVCKHSGKKCFLKAADNEDVEMQMTAGGEIKSFDKELMGSEIVVKGKLTEQKITKEMIDKQEAAVKSREAELKKGDEKGAHQCSRAMGNVNMMKQWMADNKKDYYPVYYVEAESFSAVH